MTCAATYDDANLILRLYDMRREPRLREARAWFGANFKAKNGEDVNKLCPPGSEENASYRMVVTYWEMVASFVTAGVLNQELFFQSGREILFVWIRISDLVPGMRAAHQDSSWLHNMETVSKAYIEYWKKQDAGAYDAFAARIKG